MMQLSKSQIMSKFGTCFASKDAKKEVLQGVHYGTNGVAFVTNRHFLLRVQEAHSLTQAITLHAKTGAPIDGVYPSGDIDRLLSVDSKQEVEILKEAVPSALLTAQFAFDIANRLDKKAPYIRLEERSPVLQISITDQASGVDCTFQFNSFCTNGNSVRVLHAEYLLIALKVFAAAGTSLVMKLHRPNDPIILTNNDGIDVLILPCRT